jgi:hypothetical protein
VEDALEMIRHVKVLAYFKVLYQKFPGISEENHKSLSQNSWYRSRDPNTGSSEYDIDYLY